MAGYDISGEHHADSGANLLLADKNILADQLTEMSDLWAWRMICHASVGPGFHVLKQAIYISGTQAGDVPLSRILMRGHEDLPFGQ
jgi:hypothetical protein